jgi:2-amino-4-hydroxy-6-hydroxymethyldihydropteridine diphosphokinase
MTHQTHQLVVLLGSNIAPELNLPRAVEMLREPLGIQSVSNVWETSAIGSDGPDFLNAAILFESQFSPQVIKQNILRPAEAALGRVRTSDKNAPRTIDLDVVVWGPHTLDKDIWQYAHAAVPVAELVPDLRRHPFRDPLIQVARKLHQQTRIVLRSEIAQTLQARVHFGTRIPISRVGIPVEFEYAA